MPPSRRPATRGLPRGATALAPEAVGALHRERLQDAMVRCVAARGYLETTVAEVCAEAGVSSKAFYEQCTDKEQLFRATCEAILVEVIARLPAPAADTAAPATVREALTGVFDALARWSSSAPERAHLVLVDVLSVGADGPAYRRRLVGHLTARVREAVAAVPGDSTLSDASIAIVVGGGLQVIESLSRTGKTRRSRAVALDIAAWGASYETTEPMALPPWSGPGPPTPNTRHRVRRLPHGHHQLPRAFVITQQRERILEAVTSLAATEGYGAITVPDIVATAHVSNRTFYEHFSSKHDAFIAAFDGAFTRMFTTSWYAATAQDDWPNAVREGMRAWMGFVTAEPRLARFGFNDVLTSGRQAADKVEEGYRAFAHLVATGSEITDRDVPAIAPYAIASGIASLVASWMAQGRAGQLPELTPHLVFAVLAPYLGTDEARRAAGAG